jgi:hypothetical protein
VGGVAAVDEDHRQYPYRRVLKVDFLFLTISPLPLASLWEKLLTGAGAELYSIYLHVTTWLLANAERCLLAKRSCCCCWRTH